MIDSATAGRPFCGHDLREFESVPLTHCYMPIPIKGFDHDLRHHAAFRNGSSIGNRSLAGNRGTRGRDIVFSSAWTDPNSAELVWASRF